MQKEAIKHIILRCTKKDSASQMELYRVYSVKMFNVAYRIVGNKEEAEEITHDCFIKIFDNIKKYIDKPEYLENSLKRIVINSSIDHIRKSNRFIFDNNDISNLEDKTDIDCDDIDDKELQIELVRSAIEQLPPSYHAILSMKLVEGVSNSDIAKQLNIESSTVRSQILRAKRKVLEFIKSKNNG